MNAMQPITDDVGRQAHTHKKDEQAIEALAKETSIEVERVRALFEKEVARLATHARIKTYVSVLATRLVRATLQETRHLPVQ